MRFKVGDKVRLTNGFAKYGYNSPEDALYRGTEATIAEVESGCGPYRLSLYDGETVWVGIKEVEPAGQPAISRAESGPTFQFGDKVRVSRDWARSGAGEDNEEECHGQVGVVLNARCSEGTYEVAFPNGYSWYIESCFLRPACEPERSCLEDACCRDSGQPAKSRAESGPEPGPSFGVGDHGRMDVRCPAPCDGCEPGECGRYPEAKPAISRAGSDDEDAGLSVASTGAVRSKDADNVRYDLITPIGLDRVAVSAWAYYEQGETCDNDDPAAIRGDTWSSWHAGAAAAKIYQFLGNDSGLPERILSFAFLDLCWAASGCDGDYERFRRMAAGCDRDDANFELIPYAGMEAVARAYHEGSIKYDAYNWEKGMTVLSLLNHGIRHIYLWLDGDRTEDHLGHAMWNVLAAIHSYVLWPHLNEGQLRGPGCTPPRKGVVA
jgi:hypothetical protein